MAYPKPRDLYGRLVRSGQPATYGLILAIMAVLIAENLTLGLTEWVGRWIMFRSNDWFIHPWTLVTGSLIGSNIFCLILSLAWLWWCGGSVERSIGTRTFLALWSGLSAVTALSLYAGYLFLHEPGVLYLVPIVCCITVVWGLLNHDEVILLWGMLPLRGITLAWFSLVGVLASYGPPLGLFALTGCAAAWGFVEYRHRRRRYAGTIHVGRERRRAATEAGNGLLERFRAWRHARRFAKLMRDSGVDVKDPLNRR